MEKVAMMIILLPFLVFAQTQNQCIPRCTTGQIAPNQLGGSPCLCTFEATLPGCTVAACEPGVDATKSYTCQCTPENHQDQCITLRCTNGTETHSSVATVISQSTDQAVEPSCNNLCNCGIQPSDCTNNSKRPSEGGPACSCNHNFWPTGCTLKPCELGDTGNDDYFCECTKEYAPEFCLSPQCKHRLI